MVVISFLGNKKHPNHIKIVADIEYWSSFSPRTSWLFLANLGDVSEEQVEDFTKTWKKWKKKILSKMERQQDRGLLLDVEKSFNSKKRMFSIYQVPISFLKIVFADLCMESNLLFKNSVKIERIPFPAKDAVPHLMWHLSEAIWPSQTLSGPYIISHSVLTQA